MDVNWKDDILSAFKKFCDAVPDSFVEKKEYAITLHYRTSEKEKVKPAKKVLLEDVEKLTSKYDTLDVRKGKKSLEARVAGITKGFIVQEILKTHQKNSVDFVMSIGDDVTDEDMFVALANEPDLRNVFTCTVGKKEKSCSKAYLEKQSEVLDALHALSDTTAP